MRIQITTAVLFFLVVAVRSGSLLQTLKAADTAALHHLQGAAAASQKPAAPAQQPPAPIAWAPANNQQLIVPAYSYPVNPRSWIFTKCSEKYGAAYFKVGDFHKNLRPLTAITRDYTTTQLLLNTSPELAITCEYFCSYVCTWVSLSAEYFAYVNPVASKIAQEDRHNLCDQTAKLK